MISVYERDMIIGLLNDALDSMAGDDIGRAMSLVQRGVFYLENMGDELDALSELDFEGDERQGCINYGDGG